MRFLLCGHSTVSVDEANEESGGPFRYSPFSSPDQIRLLQIQPISEPDNVSSSTQLTIRIVTVSLHEVQSKYLALSYVWGSPTLSARISCNGQQVAITQNLHRALRTMSCSLYQKRTELWKQKKPIYLWADGICINQSDTEEKKIQVSLMGEIYRKAKGVIAYLGAPVRGDPRDAMIGLAAWIENQPVRDYLPPPKPKRGSDMDPEGWNWLNTTPGVIRDFWANTWFIRSWIAQELVLAPKLCFLFGDGSQHAVWPLELVQLVSSNMLDCANPAPGMDGSSPKERRLIFATKDQFATAQTLRNKLAVYPNGLPIVEVLSNTLLAECFNPKDRIYAVLGMVRPQDRVAVRIDYTDAYSIRELLIDVAEYCIKCGNSMEMLAINTCQPGQTLDLPSWVPSWRLGNRNTFSSALYKSGGNTRVDSYVEKSSETLTLHGIELDRVQLCGPGVTMDNALTGRWARENQTLRGVGTSIFVERAATAIYSDFSRKHRNYRTKETPDEVVYRATSADQGFSGQRAGSEDKMAFKRYREIIEHALKVSPGLKIDAPIRSQAEEADIDQLTKQTWGEYDRFITAMIPRQNAQDLTTSTYLNCLCNNMIGRKLIITKSGMLGIVPMEAEDGDLVVIFHGSQMPFILRDIEDGFHTLIGDCYLHGVMDGEEFQKPGWNERSRKFMLK